MYKISKKNVMYFTGHILSEYTQYTLLNTWVSSWAKLMEMSPQWGVNYPCNSQGESMFSQ